MNALVASIIRTLVPHIVTQIASLFLMVNINVPDNIRLQLSAVVGFVLFAIYYGGVRVLEQQWPGVGVLLGLTSSPDAYSKGDPAATASPAASTPADVPAVAETTLSLDASPAVSFAATQAKIDAVAAPLPETPYVPLDKPAYVAAPAAASVPDPGIQDAVIPAATPSTPVQ